MTLNHAILAQLARLAYAGEGDAREYCRSLRLSFTPFDRGNVEGFVCGDTSHLIVVYRGTDARDDWPVNLRAGKTTATASGRMHAGVWEAFRDSWDDVRHAIMETVEVDADHQAPIFVGHSLGGALATIAASRFRHSSPVLVTFGALAAGDKRFARDVEGFATVTRYVNCCDIVPRLLRFTFAHPGQPTYINRHGVVVPASTCVGRFADRLLARLQRPLRGIHDHGMHRYVDALTDEINRTYLPLTTHHSPLTA